MMILPLADALQNTMQNLVSRIAGLDNEALANRGIGMGAAMGNTVRSIAYQFKGENVNQAQGSDFISRVVKSATSNEASPIQTTSFDSRTTNIMENSSPIPQANIMNSTENINNETNISNTNSTGGMSKAFKIGKEVMNMGMYMAEGKNFKNNNYENNRIYNRPNINDTRKEDVQEKTNKIISIEEEELNE